MEVLNNLCEQYICYMFTEQIKDGLDQTVDSYLTENEDVQVINEDMFEVN